jgi:endoglucanase
MTYWDYPRQGANLPDAPVFQTDLLKAKSEGIRLLRLAPNAWLSMQRDFLLANADEFMRLTPADLERLLAVLHEAGSLGLQVVVTTRSLPGARWSEQNLGIDDRRIWSDDSHLKQAEEFWRRLAIALKGHPAVAAYDLLSDPHPERRDGFFDPDGPGVEAWMKETAGTAADLDRFYRRLVGAIRAVDTETPIIVESGFYASPKAFRYLKPLADDKVLYSFHASPKTEALESYLAPVSEWQKRHSIPPSRIFVGEVTGPAELTQNLRDRGWHHMSQKVRPTFWNSGPISE